MAAFTRASPYNEGTLLSLPVPDLATSLPYYTKVFGLETQQAPSSGDTCPYPTAQLRSRGGAVFGLAQNGGDPANEGAFLEVDDVEAAFAEMQANGLEQQAGDYAVQKHGASEFRLFFVVAPDGLCFCIGERTVSLPVGTDANGIETRRVALQQAVAARRNAFPGEDSWALRLQLRLASTGGPAVGQDKEPWRCLVRAVTPGDAEGLVLFGTEGLSDASRASFAPYEWSSPHLADEFDAAITKSISKIKYFGKAIIMGVFDFMNRVF